MQKEGSRGLFNSREAKINLFLKLSMVLIFALTMILAEALTINLVTPATNTFNRSIGGNTRMVNITFNATWSLGGADPLPHENVSNCSLWINSTGNVIQWQIVKNASNNTAFPNDGGSNFTDNFLQNGSNGLSYMNFTFSRDGNFTFAIGCLNASNNGTTGTATYGFSANISLFIDASPPTFNFSVPVHTKFNKSVSGAQLLNISINDTGYGANWSANNTVNISITLGGTRVAYLNYSTDGAVTNISCDSTAQARTLNVYCNTTYNFNSNGTYTVNITGQDALGNYGGLQNNLSSMTVTIDQIAPVINSFNITNGSGDAGMPLGNSNVSEVPVTGDGTWAQGKSLRFFANVSDNLTMPLAAEIQFFNVSANNGAGAWQTIADTSNTSNLISSNISSSNLTLIPTNITVTADLGPNTTGMVNLTFRPSVGRGVFEGHNITFRIVVNDTVGNRNNDSRFLGNGENVSRFLAFGNASEGSATNITIQINDTTKPTLSVYVGSESGPLNNSNSSDATPTVVWNVSESNQLKYVAVQFDALVSQSCNNFRNFTQAALDVEDNRNGTFTLSDTGSCPDLANGTHTVRVTVEDVWGNSELYIHSFQVQGGKPGVIFNGVTRSDGLSLGPGIDGRVSNSTINNTDITVITSKMGLNFSGLAGAVNIQNLTYISSCNTSSTKVFDNSSVIYPFNESTCPSTTTISNQTLTITVTDNVGNSNSTVYGFTLDNVAPTLTVNSPTDGLRFNGIGNISVSVIDDGSSIDTIGAYLDGREVFTNHSSNGSSRVLVNGTGITYLANSTLNESLGPRTAGAASNLTPGVHTIKVSVNDTLGNSRNSSLITFVVIGPINFGSLGLNGTNGTLITFNSNFTFDLISSGDAGGDGANITLVNLTNASGEPLVDTRTVTDQTLKLFMALNTSRRSIGDGDGNTNVSIVFNASAAVWNKYNFTVKQNESTSIVHIEHNWTVKLQQLLWFNQSIRNFLPNNNSYYGIVKYPVNATQYSIGSFFEVWFFPDINDLTTKTNLTECDAGFNPSFTFASGSACWNNTANGSIDVFVPHFSAVAFVNNSNAPWVNVTTPAGNATGIQVEATLRNQSVSMFVTNITVSSDAVACFSSLNGTVANATMAKSGKVCIGQTERFKSGGAGYNFSFWVIDSDGNTNRHIWNFTVFDTTAPFGASISTSGLASTSATINVVGDNETVNVTVLRGTTNGSLTTANMETDFNTTQAVSITGLTASTTYYFNVTRCDFSGNCIGNGTYSFTTTAAAAAAAASSSSSGGGGGGAAPVSNVQASTGAAWDTITAGSTGTLTSSSASIAIVGITFNAVNTLSHPSLNLESLNSNPLSSAAAGKVYQYLQLTHSNVADSDVSGVTITFKVPKSWLASNGVAEGDVVLYRYSNNAWIPLSTTMTSSDSDYATYQSSSPGFSLYAVGNKEAAPAAPVTEQPTEPSTEAPTEAPPTAETPPTSAGTTTTAPDEDGGLSNTAMAWIVVIVIAVVAGVGYFIYQRRKEE